MICTTYFLTFFSELIPPTGIFSYISNLLNIFSNAQRTNGNLIPKLPNYPV